MSGEERTLADFVGEFSTSVDRLNRNELEFKKGRIILSTKRLILAGNEDRHVIPLKHVFDLGGSNIPNEIQRYLSNAVSIGYREDGDPSKTRVSIVKSDDDKLDKFRILLYKALINGIKVNVKHPAKISGRVTDSKWGVSRLKIRKKGIVLKGATSIDLNSVQDVELSEREVNGEKRRVLSITHTTARGVVTTQVNIPDSRSLNLLGRFIRSEYREIVRQVEELSLSDAEMEIVVGLYSGATQEQLPMVLDKDTNEVQMLLNRLVEKQILREAKSGLELTSRGKVIANRNLEAVNN